ncbi:uncharacterized protein LOC135688140 [Rhopilema esculentum]|uniref:uncharacterized protein LOC135688140 n=1 Tax=Rhopilema esculentum TaxID=499914 RepID=UPI0031E12C87
MLERKTLLMLCTLCYAACLVSTQSEFDVGIGQQQQTTFGQKVDEIAVKDKIAEQINTTEKRTFLYHSKDKKPMAVYDKLFKGSIILMLRSYLTSLGQDSWLFNNYDPDHVNVQRTNDNVPWVNYRDPAEFEKMLVSKTLVKAINDLNGVKEEWYPCKVTGKVVRRGDHTKVVADSAETGEFSVLFYLNSKWRKNYYGELYFFDDDREIMHGVTPRPGRVVIWDSSILRLTRPPSVSFKQGQILLHITYSKSKQKMLNEHEKWTAFWNDRLEAKKTWYLPDYEETDDKPLVPDVSKHLFANYSTLKGEKIFVFDNLFPKDLLDHMRAHVLKYGTYFYDDSIDEESDNVQWIAGLDMPLYLKSPYWKIIHAVAKYASGSSEWFPYDVSTNLVRNADHTRIHLDTGHDKEKEWTFLVYLNPNWTQNYYGETAFFERNSDDTEIVAEVRPRYGRSVIFQGQIPHSARPPSLNFTGARLTFVTKLQENEYYGRYKNLEEELRHFQSHSGAIATLETLSRSGDELQYMQQMKKVRDQRKTPKYKTENADTKQPVENEGGEDGVEYTDKVDIDSEGEEGENEETEGEEEEEEPEEEGEAPEDVSELVQRQRPPADAQTDEPNEEEEENQPDVQYIVSKMEEIKKKDFGNAKRVADLYNEMKSKDAELLAKMSEKFPTLL